MEQADRHKSKIENEDSIPTFKIKNKRSCHSTEEASNPKKFNSLPSRKKKTPSRPVKRSSSDAAAKKPSKRPSIFNFFSRKSDTNVAQTETDDKRGAARRLVRSKSDVGSSSKSYKLKKTLKDSKSSNTSAISSSKHIPTQLSPIIENSQKEDYFEQQFNRERRKSDAVTDREKHESGLGELLQRSRNKAEVDGTLLTRNPISESIKDKILTLQAKSNENMHSSQQPAQKIPLTKGRTVNGMVKRLSMERFSPPPTINGPAFSYIRPNDGLTYAQLDHEQSPHQFNSLSRREMHQNNLTREYKSPLRDMRSPDREFNANRYTSQSPLNGYHGETYVKPKESNSPAGVTTIRISSPWQQLCSTRNLSDEDEGLGIETRKYFDEEYRKASRSKSPSEPPIVPVIRSITPERDVIQERRINNYRPLHEYNDRDKDMEYRRSRLESNILTRRFGEQKNLLKPDEEPTRSFQYNYLNQERSDPQNYEGGSTFHHTKFHTTNREESKPIPYEREQYRDHYENSATDENGHLIGYEPKSLDSKVSNGEYHYRSSPDNLKRYDVGSKHANSREHWQSSLKRDKLQQRSFDKGDSGIENDFRKESFNGDISTK